MARDFSAASDSLTPKAYQRNDGAQFVEYQVIACSNALGQIGHGTTGTSMWFAIPARCGKKGGAVGKISLATSAVVVYPIGSNASPLAIAYSGGYVWAVDQHRDGSTRKIYRFKEDGQYVTFSLPRAIAVSALAAGPDGNLWFCGAYQQHGVTQAGIGNITPTGLGTVYPIQGASTPILTSIDSAADRNLWVTDQRNGTIVRVTTAGDVTTFAVGGHPGAVTDAGKSIVYSDSNVGQLSVMDFSGNYTVYPAPSGSFPGEIARKGHDLVAYIDTASNSSAVGVFDAASSTYATEAQAPNGRLRYIFNAPDGNAWFTDAFGHVGAYLRYVLTASPAQISLDSSTCSASFTVSESNYIGSFTATSQDLSIATVLPNRGSDPNSFKVSSGSEGTTSIVVKDSMQNVVFVWVRVNSQCRNKHYCAQFPFGPGYLPDGDFSDSRNRPRRFSKGKIVAPNFLVTQTSVGFYGSADWGQPVPYDLCSVDLGGNGNGGIVSEKLTTNPNMTYQVTFYMSANSLGGPSTKKLSVSAANSSMTFTWYNPMGAPQGVWMYQTLFEFVATGYETTLTFTSLDEDGSNYEPVIAGISVG